MDMSSLGALFTDFDLAAFLPNMNTVMGWVETALRICVMAGPLLLLGFGLLYLLAPPKEANHSLGYRFWWSMASLDAWQFTHRLVGWIWAPLGLVMTIVMASAPGSPWGPVAPVSPRIETRSPASTVLVETEETV